MEDDWIDSYMQAWRDYGDVTLRAKWTMDGAKTVAEAALRFRERAEELEELAQAGFELECPVEDDHAILIRPGEESAMRLVEAQNT